MEVEAGSGSGISSFQLLPLPYQKGSDSTSASTSDSDSTSLEAMYLISVLWIHISKKWIQILIQLVLADPDQFMDPLIGKKLRLHAFGYRSTTLLQLYQIWNFEVFWVCCCHQAWQGASFWKLMLQRVLTWQSSEWCLFKEVVPKLGWIHIDLVPQYCFGYIRFVCLFVSYFVLLSKMPSLNLFGML